MKGELAPGLANFHNPPSHAKFAHGSFYSHSNSIPCMIYLPNVSMCGIFTECHGFFLFFKKKSFRKNRRRNAEVLLQWLAPKHVTVSACIELRDKDDPQEVEYLKPITQREPKKNVRSGRFKCQRLKVFDVFARFGPKISYK